MWNGFPILLIRYLLRLLIMAEFKIHKHFSSQFAAWQLHNFVGISTFLFRMPSILNCDNECSTYVLVCRVTVHPLEAFSSHFSYCGDCDFVDEFYLLLNTLSLKPELIKSQTVIFCLPFLFGSIYFSTDHWFLSHWSHAHNFYWIDFPKEVHYSFLIFCNNNKITEKWKSLMWKVHFRSLVEFWNRRLNQSVVEERHQSLKFLYLQESSQNCKKKFYNN